MAFRIYLDQTVVRIIDTEGRNEPIYYNPGQVKYYVKDGRFIFFDGIEQQDFNNKGYQDFVDKTDTGFATEEDFIEYLNSFINKHVAGTFENPGNNSDVDNNNRLSRNTVFGDKIVAKRVPQLAAQFQYPLRESDVKQPPEVGAGGTITQENTLLKINTAAQVGSFASIQSRDTLRYIPGYECYAFWTPDFNDPVEGQTQFWGLMDAETGFGCGYNGLDFVFLYRRDGVDQYFIIDLDIFEKENGFRLNPQKGNVYLLTYGFLGYAPAKMEVIPPQGGLRKLHTFAYPNAYDQTHLNQTFLPVRGELSNGAGNTPMTMSVGSVNAGIIDGSVESEYTFSRPFNFFVPEVIVSGNTEIVAFRSKTTFGGKTNYVNARLFNFNIAVDLNKNSIVVIYRNPVVLNTPTWTDVDTDSVLEYSEDILIDFANSKDTFYSDALFKTGSLDKETIAFRFDLRPGDTGLFAILTPGAGEATFSTFWKELF